MVHSTTVAVSSAIAALLCWQSFPPPSTTPIHGWTHPDFIPVLRDFQANFDENMEREGASVAIYHRGEVKAHLWGGYADSSARRQWKRDTRTLLFSSTKAVASLVVAILVDRGVIHYDDFVVTHWPEYGQNGKNATTIEDVLTHKAGLPYLEERIEQSEVGTAKLRQKLERAIPVWEPGTASGYHAVTFGFIIDEIVKKVDGRDAATFFREEVAERHDLDVSIGVPHNEMHRSARITLPDTVEYLRDVARDPRLLAMLGIMYARFDGILEKVLATHSWINFGYDMLTLNDPAVASLPLAAVTGVATADSLARTFTLLLQGQLVSNSTLSLLTRPTLSSWHIERVVLYPMMKGHGFFYEPHPRVPGAFTWGHPGYGGQMVHVDPVSELVFVYLSNGLKTGSGELCWPSKRILNTLYNIIS